ncbi:flavin-containing amine oxidoreductase-domain containing protein [Paraphysoderma sedebokerense]|nr:flavin-containing amine oxidoreductase-domain containing protein [Paraphysoderma sedebokerense]
MSTQASPHPSPLRLIDNSSLAQAAFASRLPPDDLSSLECTLFLPLYRDNHNLRRRHLNIRNRILRAWLDNPSRSLSLADVFHRLPDHPKPWVSIVYYFLIRHSHINYFIVSPPRFPNSAMVNDVNRKTFIVIGAGISGLTAARQIRQVFGHVNPPPRIIVLEARSRVGGRILTHPLHTKIRADGTSDDSCKAGVDLGASIVHGWDGGNPLKVLVKNQLKLSDLDSGTRMTPELYDVNGSVIDTSTHVKCETIFNQVLSDTLKVKEPLVEIVDEDRHGGRKKRKATEHPRTRGKSLPSTLNDYTAKTKSPSHSRRNSTNTIYFPSDSDTQLKKGGDHNSKDDFAPINLGETLKKKLSNHPSLRLLSDKDLRVLQWHFANLELTTNAPLDDVSLLYWNQGENFLGPHSMIIGGFGQVIRALAYDDLTSTAPSPQSFDLHLNKCVTKIEYKSVTLSQLQGLPSTRKSDNWNIRVTCNDGSSIVGDAAVVTIPLGVLKHESIAFEPTLPEWKQQSIKNLGFGVVNKVVLAFKHAFWNERVDSFGCVNLPDEVGGYDRTRGQFFLFQNMTAVVNVPTLTCYLVGESAKELEVAQDCVIIERCMSILSRIHPEASPIPQPIESIVTRWTFDEFSRGSASYLANNSTVADVENLRKTIGNTLFWAGEATCKIYNGTITGAVLSGTRVAAEVGDTFLGKIRPSADLEQCLSEDVNIMDDDSADLDVRLVLEESSASTITDALVNDELSSINSTSNAPLTTKRKRGRPRKYQDDASDSLTPSESASVAVSRQSSVPPENDSLLVRLPPVTSITASLPPSNSQSPLRQLLQPALSSQDDQWSAQESDFSHRSVEHEQFKTSTPLIPLHQYLPSFDHGQPFNSQYPSMKINESAQDEVKCYLCDLVSLGPVQLIQHVMNVHLTLEQKQSYMHQLKVLRIEFPPSQPSMKLYPVLPVLPGPPSSKPHINPFLLFTKTHWNIGKAHLSATNENGQQTVRAVLSAIWKMMSNDDKQPWSDKITEMRNEYNFQLHVLDQQLSVLGLTRDQIESLRSKCIIYAPTMNCTSIDKMPGVPDKLIKALDVVNEWRGRLDKLKDMNPVGDIGNQLQDRGTGSSENVKFNLSVSYVQQLVRVLGVSELTREELEKLAVWWNHYFTIDEMRLICFAASVDVEEDKSCVPAVEIGIVDNGSVNSSEDVNIET